MAPIDVSPAVDHCPGTAWFAGRNPDRTVVWLRGEHDTATVAALSETMARAIALDTPGLVVDLSDVEFMDASTVGVIVRTQELLRPRTLVLRSPSKRARRVLELCELAELVDPPSIDAAHVTDPVGALGTWVAVPATERADRPSETEPADEPSDADAPTPGGEPELVRARRVAPGQSAASTVIHHPGDERRGTVAGRGGP